MRSASALLLGLLVVASGVAARLPFPIRCALVTSRCAARPCCRTAPATSVRSRMPCCTTSAALDDHPLPTVAKDDPLPLASVAVGEVAAVAAASVSAPVARAPSRQRGAPLYLRHRALLL